MIRPVFTTGRRLTARCEHNPHFDRLFETLVYPADEGTVQPTIAFWQSVLAARQPVHEADGASTNVATIG